MKRMLLVSSFLLYITVLHAQLKEDFSPNPTGWTLSQGAKFEKINGNDIIITPGVGGNNPAVIGTPVVNKTSNTVEVCLDIKAYTANLNNQIPFPCNTYIDVLFVKSTVTSAGQAANPANIIARVNNHLLPIAGGKTCFTTNFPSSITSTSFKVFLFFHASCVQQNTKYVIDNIDISGLDEECEGPTCLPTAIDDNFVRTNASELSFNAVLYGSNINYPAPPAGYVCDATGTDNDQNDSYNHLKWSLLSTPSNGSVVINEDGTATITRSNSLVSQLTFTYQLCDDGPDNNFSTTGDNLCATATVTANFSTGGLTPVSLVNYSALRNGSYVTLKWTTLNENNNKGFDVQRSISNGNYETIAFISSKAETGNSNVSLNYEYKDNNISNQTSAYRLVQIDNDGVQKIHGIKVVNGESSSFNMILYPNPSFNGQVSLNFGNSNEKDIIVSDVQGKTVKVWNSFRNQKLTINDLKSGLYVLQVKDKISGERKSEKILIIRN
jgi:hypothetical protein